MRRDTEDGGEVLFNARRARTPSSMNTALALRIFYTPGKHTHAHICRHRRGVRKTGAEFARARNDYFRMPELY